MIEKDSPITPTIRRIVIGNRVRLARRDAGLSGPELAKLSNVSYDRIKKIEGAKTGAKAEELARIAEVVGVDQSKFIV